MNRPEPRGARHTAVAARLERDLDGRELAGGDLDAELAMFDIVRWNRLADEVETDRQAKGYR